MFMDDYHFGELPESPRPLAVAEATKLHASARPLSVLPEVDWPTERFDAGRSIRRVLA